MRNDSLLRAMLIQSASLQRLYAAAIDEQRHAEAGCLVEAQRSLNAAISRAGRRTVIEAKATEVLS